MVQIKHLYIQYGYAVTLYENNLQDQCNIITPTHLQKSIENGINSFRVIPQNPLIPEQEISFKYENIEKGNPKKGIFLSSHIVTTNRNAQKTWNVASKFLQDLEAENAADQLEKVEDAKVSIIPLSGEFLSFGAKGIDRAKVRLKKRELAFGLITTLTPLKPSLQIELENYCILPDIPLKQMIEFIALFDKMRRTGLGEKVMTGKTNKEGKPQRPKIFRGNFPHAPKNGAMGAVALLDAIGEYIKEAETSCIAQSVLDSLEGNKLYLIKSGEAIPISFNHYVIEIAKSGNLHSIVDQIYYSHLYKTPKRQYNDPDYERFDFHTARFLQQFNRPSFLDFLSNRVEYPTVIKILFKKYFINMEKLDSKIVDSAAIFGNWLNNVAFFSALEEGEGKEINDLKAKYLIEMESAIYAAKTSDALLAQVMILAGRSSKRSAPEEILHFMTSLLIGEIDLSTAKNLLIAFSRIKQTEKKMASPSEEEFEMGDETREKTSFANE